MGKYWSPINLQRSTPAPSSSSQPSNCGWASLPDDLLVLILDKLFNNSVYDYTRCATVCKSWFRCCLQIDDKKKNQQLPLLFIPTHKKHSKNPSVYNITNKSSSRLNLPYVGKRYSGSSHGWLIFADTKPMGLTLTLFNPFTSAKIHLPPLLENHKIKKAVLSDDPSTNKYELLVLQIHGRLALFKSRRWIYDANYFDPFYVRYGFKDDNIIHLNQKFYALIYGKLGSIEIVDDFIRLEGSVNEIYSESWCQSSYLAESIRGTLLFVQKFLSYDPLFRVYEIEEEENKRFIPTLLQEGGEKGLEDQALFLGQYSQSVSVRASGFAGCKSNSIYFIGNCLEPGQVGVYTLGDQCIIYKKLHHPHLHSPIWIQPRPNLQGRSERHRGLK